MNLHTAVAHRVVVGIAVGVAAPIVVVTHTVEAVRLVIMIAGSMVVVAVQRMTTLAGSGHGPSVIPPGLRAVLLPRVVPLDQVLLIFSLLKRWETEFFGDGFSARFHFRNRRVEDCHEGTVVSDIWRAYLSLLRLRLKDRL